VKVFYLVDVADFTDVPVDQLSPAKARQILDRVDLLSKIREEILSHPHLEERLSLCQPSGDTPDWWQPGKHDKELLLGAAKHGLGRTDITILNDPDFSFHKLLTRGMYAGTQTPKLMDKSEKAIKIESREDILKFDKDEILVKLEKGEGTLKIEKVGAKKDKDQSAIDKKPDTDSEKSQVELTIVKAEIKPEEKSISNSLTITTVARTSDMDNIAIVKNEEKSELAIEPVKCDTKANQISTAKLTDEKTAKEVNSESAESPAVVELEKEDKTQEKDIKHEAESAEKSDESQTQDVMTETAEKNEMEVKEKIENVEKSKKVETSEHAIEDDNNKSAKPDKIPAKEEVETQEAKSLDVIKEKTKVPQIEDKCSVQAAELKAMFPDLEVIQPLSRLTQIDTFVLRDKPDYNNEPTVMQLLAHGCVNTSIKWPKVNFFFIIFNIFYFKRNKKIYARMHAYTLLE